MPVNTTELQERARRLWRRLRLETRKLTQGVRSRWPPSWRQVALAGLVVLLAVGIVWQTCGLRGCPAVERLAAYQPGGAPVLLDRDGEEFAQLAPVQRELVRLEELPSHVSAAFLAVEDQRFYEHGAVDWRRVGGSALANVRAGGIAEGSSTITMQLARNIFPDRLPARERTLRRKLLEVRVAGLIEDRFTKDEILELYLNHIYFGGSIYGIEAAAQSYFGTPATSLSLPEAAALAAMPRAPNSYNPRRFFERSVERRGLVLSLMADQGRITREEAERAQRRGVRIRPGVGQEGRETAESPYFVRAVRRALEAELGDGLYSQPLRVHTTLDPQAQRAAEAAIEQQLRLVERGSAGPFDAPPYRRETAGDSTGTPYLQGAAVVMDPGTGDIRALVGGRDFDHSPYDRATQARRQVGSAFKPFVYAAALEEGYAASQWLIDEPLRMELTGGEVWEPQNFSGGYEGEVTLRDAAVRSNNVATVRLAMAVGLDRVRETARKAGVDGTLPDLPSLALGTAELSLLELTTAYAPFAAGGQTVEPRWFTRVETTDGEIIHEREIKRDRALDAGVAFMVTDLLRDAVDRGTGRGVRNAGFRAPAAGKTGTTDDGFDAWFVGYTPDLLAGVWLGFDRPRPIAPRASGGELAAPAWGHLMRDIYRDRASEAAWEQPPSVVERRVDPTTGLILAEGCDPAGGRATGELFLRGDLPSTICPDGQQEAGMLRRAWSAASRFVGRAGTWVAGLFDREDDLDEAERQRREEYLGRPRLPRAEDISRMEDVPDSAREGMIGVPIDSLPEPGEPPSGLPDTASDSPTDTAADSLPAAQEDDAGDAERDTASDATSDAPTDTIAGTSADSPAAISSQAG